MYEIDLSTLILIGIDEYTTKVITTEREFIIKESCKKIERNKATNRLVKMASKTPIIVEETRNIIFFPLKSTREKNNIWISFNHLVKYTKDGQNAILKFDNNKEITIRFSYYIIDNQVTRNLILDYVVK